MRESKFEHDFLEEIKQIFPTCFVLKNASVFVQGIPDRLILFEDKWAMLEFKESQDAPPRPNQPYYVELFNEMSYASFVYPENKEQVLDELQQAFRHSRPRSARLSEWE